MFESKIEYLITREGIVRRYTTEERVNAEAAIEKVMSQTSITIPRLAVGLGGGIIHGRVEGQMMFIAQRLMSVRLNTWFEPTTEGEHTFLSPVFAKQDDTTIQLDAKWIVPGELTFWLVSGRAMGRIDDVNCYLVCQKVGENGIYMPPLNNLYENARVCMGRGFAEQMEQEIRTRSDLRNEIGLHFRLAEIFNSTSWNSDLPPEEKHSEALFRFDLNGVQLPMADEWRDQLRPVSGTQYNWLANLPRE